jgi:hypothetical protein
MQPGEAARVRVLVHRLGCRDHLSIRRVQARLANEYALRRSVGRIFAILRDFACPECEGPPDDG